MAREPTEFRLVPWEIHSIKAACEFANRGDWRVFVPLARRTKDGGRVPRQQRTIIWDVRKRRTESDSRKWRRELRAWLAQIVKYRGPVPNAVRDEINARLGEIPTRGGRYQLMGDWRGRAVQATGLLLQFDGPRAHYVHAVALLTLHEHWTKRLSRCKWCAEYFFNDREQPRGNRRLYCNDAHRQAYFRHPDRAAPLVD